MKSIFINLKNVNFALYYNFSSLTKELFILQIRTSHFKSNSKGNSIIPLIVYNNFEFEKISILKDNKGKTGIYRLINLVNSKSYIGSANNLTVRF